jgi:hypothetical protein
MLNRLFLDHPRSVGESYGEHLAMAGSFGIVMILGGIACLVHALLPCAFTTTGSGMVRRLYGRMVTNRVNRTNAAAAIGTD